MDGFAAFDLQKTQIQKEYAAVFCQYCLQNCGRCHCGFCRSGFCQNAKDNYTQNYELSYERALALSRFWQNSGIDFGKNCEVLISGSGTGGSMRDSYEKNNQRLLIHIIPKTGEIEQKNNEN